MLNFRNTFTVFFFAIGLGNILRFAFGIDVPGWYFWLVVILTLLTVAYGSAYIGSNFHFRVICRDPEPVNRQLALSFDDGVDPVVTPVVLDILNRHGIKAAFFCIGAKCEDQPGLLKRIDSEGHIIGNHSYSHSYWFDFYSSRSMLKEIQDTDLLIERITGKRPKFFRPPYGVTNPMLKRALKQSGHLAIGWSIRSHDTNRKKTAEQIIRRVNRKMKPGDIILFHDNIKSLPEILEAVIIFGKENGYTFVRIDEMIDQNAYTS